MDEPLATVEFERLNERGGFDLHARIVGEVDLSNVDHVEAALLGALGDVRTDGPTAFVIDLSPTKYLDSAALRVIERLSRTCSDRALTLRLVAPDGSFAARILAFSGLDTQISVVRSDDPVPSADAEEAAEPF